MKALRRSIKGDKGDRAGPEPPGQRHKSVPVKSELAIKPPKKVIKALFDYEADPSKQHELSFHKGDFFHVISREDDDDWYEAANPLIPSARGLVPVSFFEVIGKSEGERQSAGSQQSAGIGSPPSLDSGYVTASSSHERSSSSNMISAPIPNARMSATSGGKGRAGAMVYGIVMYDFSAERPDELDAKAGEAIIVIAQSNPEWFVAKPIGRLGGPGLIPVSFIEIKDMATGQSVADPHEAVRKAGVPKVEEWKKLAADYKKSSIPLGHFGSTSGTTGLEGSMDRMSMQQNGQYRQNGNLQPPPNQQGGLQRPLLCPISASVPRYCFENDKYWYIIECVLEDGSHWELSRYYQNFYDFQIRLLQAFPNEAGNGANGTQRILPYMPGPVTYVTDHISNMRRESLDDYVKRLLNLPPYISRSDIVKELFHPRDGDFELDPSAMGEGFRLSQGSRGSGGYPQQQQQHQQQQQSQQSPQQYSGGGNELTPGAVHRQPSSLTQDSSRNSGNNLTPASSTAALVPPGSAGNQMASHGQQQQQQQQQDGGGGGASQINIKCWWGEDLIRLRAASDISFESLRLKLQDRFKAREDIRVQWQDPATQNYHELFSDQDLDWVLERSQGRLILFADYA